MYAAGNLYNKNIILYINENHENNLFDFYSEDKNENQNLYFNYSDGNFRNFRGVPVNDENF